MRMDPHIYASSAWIRNRMAIPNQQQFILIHNSGAKPGQALWNQFEKIRKIAVKAVNKGSLQNQFSVKVYKKKLQFFFTNDGFPYHNAQEIFYFYGFHK